MRPVLAVIGSVVLGACSSATPDAARREALSTTSPTPPPTPAPVSPRSIAGFRPSLHGFAFRNDFSGSPLPFDLGTTEKKLGLPTRYGLCGGMSSAAADYFLAGRPIPADTAPPAHGSPLYIYLYARQSASFAPAGTMALRFIEWMRLPDDGDDGARARTAREIAPIESALARGEPVLLGLVLVSAEQTREPWHNHQVLAYAAKRDGPVLEVAIYDPNFPKRDDAVIRIEEREDGPVCARVVPGRRATPVRGLFKMAYAPADPHAER